MSLLRRLAAGGDVFDHVAPTLDALRRREGDLRLLRFSTPPRTMAFSRRDQLSPHFPAAAAAAEAAGFRVEVRPVGGAFAPLHGGSLVIEEFGRSASESPESPESPDLRFVRHTSILVDVLRGLGVDARIGELQGEYCPGRYSINAGGRVKLSGTAQRVSGAAWLVSSVLQVADAEALRDVTASCGRIMGAGISVATIGSLDEEVGRTEARTLARRIAAEYRSRGLIGPSSVLNSVGEGGR